MDPNEKLSLKRRTQRRIRRRKAGSPWVYLAVAAVLIGVCVLLKFFPLGAKAASYEGAAGSSFTATFTGNINCVGDGKVIDANGYSEYFNGVRELLEKADYLSITVNDPILDDYIETYESGMAIKFADKYFNTDIAEAFSELGVDDVTVCNREVFRYGSKGVFETSMTLERMGMSVNGLHTSGNTDAAVATYYEDGDHSIIHVGIEASDDRLRSYSSYDVRTYNERDNNILRDLSDLREQNPDSFIAVTVSWGEFYLLKPSSYMKDLAHSLIDNGADVVIGTGIQMVLSAEKYNEGCIFYGLGNLVANEAYTMTQRGVVLNCVFDDSGKVTYELVPLSVKGGYPEISDSKIILRTLVSDIGSNAEYSISNGVLTIVD
ncbi:MAG: CapA family protein [Clostridia bacterium]|nr:CapA family protein [Clostridia bacterium]